MDSPNLIVTRWLVKLNGSQKKTQVINLGKGQIVVSIVWVSQGIALKYCQPRVEYKFMALSCQYAQIFLMALAML